TRRMRGGMASALLNIRRTTIFIILALAYAYFQIAGDTAALASIGLLSFAAVAQFAPAMFIGLFWRRATSLGALAGMIAGFAVWNYTLFIPTILGASSPLLIDGPFGIASLRPQALFGMDADPLTHGVLFSLFVNTLAYVMTSMLRAPRALERMQAGVFRLIGNRGISTPIRDGRAITLAELKHSVSNYLGRERTERAFDLFHESRTTAPSSRDFADDDEILHAEQLLASAIGAASSRLVLSLLLKKHEGEAETTIQLLDDASEALQYNRDLLQTALDQVEQGISVFDHEFRLSSWNNQFRALLNLPAEMGQAGTPLTDLASVIDENSEPDGREEGDLVESLLANDYPFTITMTGSERIIEIDTKSLPDGGLVISWSDATERRTAARLLQQANETLERRVRERTEELTRLNADLASARETAEAANIGKTRFLAAVGHDILQPLNAARLYTSSLVEKLADSPSQQLAGNVDDALESVEDILGAVLAISRLDSGAMTPNMTEFAADRLIGRLENEFRPIAQAKGLSLEVVTNGFHIRSDYSLLRRLLQNLVSNAIKYTTSGTVTLDARVRRNHLVFEVRDTGDGIAKDDREVIFHEFRRLDAGRRAAPGLGLGLSIVQRLAATLDHIVDFETTPGKGSTFFVSVPLTATQPEALVSGVPILAASSDFAGLTIACLDNESRILDGMRVLLEGWSCEVHLFETGPALIEAFEDIKPDITIADYHLDTGTGVEVVAEARALGTHEFSAILVTADRSAAVRAIAKAADMTLLNKPLKPAALRALLSRVAKQAMPGEPVAAE
ncbi:MAG: hybrid sensor histidine kinase/response regulator, partial [Rhizobiaceae bacterium]